jgi:cytochrome c-type biogenesis protein CcmH/NrfG
MRRTEQQILDEIVLREASLRDAQHERDAGELTAIEAATIEARETLALAKAHAELRELALPRSQRSSTRRRRTWLLVVGILCLLAAVVVLLWVSISPRQAGNSITGSVSLSRAQRVTQLLAEAQADVANGNVAAALGAYQGVLSLDPKNVDALTQSGWLAFSAGSSDKDQALITVGIADLRSAIVDGPRNPAPRLYYAIVADSTPGNRALATSEFKVFLALHPSSAQLAIARPFLTALGLSTS